MRRIAAQILGLCWAVGVAAQNPQGHLVLIGGGERPREAMEKFVELAGGLSALILLLPTASEDPDYIQSLLKSFVKDYGCRNVRLLNVHQPPDALRQDYEELVNRAGGIFFSGGDQTRIVKALKDSPLLSAIRNAYQRGAVIGGTSAGTACMSPLMITGEGNFDVVQKAAVELWPGLGFFPKAILDQHFLARRRFNRLLSVVLENPELLGVGIDEDTAVWLRPDGTFQVLGKSNVLVIDAANAQLALRPGEDKKARLFSAHHLRLFVLAPGERFDLAARTPEPAGEEVAQP